MVIDILVLIQLFIYLFICLVCLFGLFGLRKPVNSVAPGVIISSVSCNIHSPLSLPPTYLYILFPFPFPYP